MEVNVELSSKVAGAINVDDALSTQSDNAIANKVVTTAINELKNNSVENSRLEKPVFKLTLPKNIFETTNGTAVVTLSGSLISSLQQLIVNDNGVAEVVPTPIIPEKATIKAVDSVGDEIETIIFDSASLSENMSYTTAEHNIIKGQDNASSGEVKAMVFYKDVQYDISVPFYIEYPRYFGAISATAKVDANAILGLKTKTISTSNDYVGVQGLNYQRTVYAFPKYMGQLSHIYDATNFDIISGFDVSSIANVNGIDYLCYVERVPATATSLTYKFQ